ncbi:DUF1062 domain-containing protein [Pseudomonas sp. S75]|uniref:DUF1062 domain-containing protein n=1 Tax=unclassified Pseudomonas TaxID=196821 RepID=UPI0019032EAB|nr:MULTISPECIES: DUF1062 domain-containing protein [unclassified Pseudomonas]MBJ9975366.1 DUF1062 domain-containing protein [Pseudomonas sp. S30]MBK0152660.1 DUF1062 domain-containing protein [Pseudomonas sp. S75]
MTNGHVTWLISPIGYQSITKRCPCCEIKKLFFPAGTFRVNAQKKILDVWNIYKCEKCDYTWNIDVLSRIKTGKIDPELHQRFIHNNLDEVRRYAYDYPLLKRNQAELGPSPEYEIKGPSPYTYRDSSLLDITIEFEYRIAVRLINILTRKLCLNRRQVMHLIEEHALLDVTANDLNRKLKMPRTFRLDLARLYALDLPLTTRPEQAVTL